MEEQHDLLKLCSFSYRSSRIMSLLCEDDFKEVLRDLSDQPVWNSICQDQILLESATVDDSRNQELGDVFQACNNMAQQLQYHPQQRATGNQLAVVGPPQMLETTALVPYQNPHINSESAVQQAGAIPSNQEFPGDYNFQILFNSSLKYSWVFSELLNKVFISMGQALPVEISWVPAVSDLLVRATPLFSLPQHSQELVTRCLNHASVSDASNKDQPAHIHPHVIRCLNKLTRYCINEVDGRLSVLTPLGTPQTGSNTVRLMYMFMCKNSCSSGMNRRPLEIVYTLESASGEVLGRRKHEVRICSCPKRDKEKEEGEGKPTTKKRKISAQQALQHPPSGKRPLLAVHKKECDVEVVEMCVPNVEIAQDIYRQAYHIVVGHAYKKNSVEAYKPFIEEIENKLQLMEQNQ